MQEKLERILNWFRYKTSLPFKVVLIPTNRCNLKCLFCPNALPRWKGKFKASEELSDKEWQDIVKQAIKLNVKEYSIIGGGEPFVRKKAVFAIIREIKKDRENECEIITNGTLLKNFEIKELVRWEVDRILFSIDGPNAKIHDSLRGVEGVFEKAIGNLKLFSKLKRKLKKEKPYLKINMVLNRENFRLVGEMVKVIKKVGGQELALHPMREYFEFNELKKLVLSPEEKNSVNEEIKRAEKIARRKKVFLNTDMVRAALQGKVEEYEIRKIRKFTFSETIKRCYCFEPFYSMLIDPNGFVGGCSSVGKGIETLNVREKDLKEIWLSKEFAEIRKKLMMGNKFDYCLKCGLTDMRIKTKNELLKMVFE
ncbi:MAG: radical SAM protein [Candidatus Aenigmatarchaeota archaeon]